MSDPVTNLEIEDVLSSIRRLVAEGDKLRVPASVQAESSVTLDVPLDIEPAQQRQTQPTQEPNSEANEPAQLKEPLAEKFVLTSALRVDESPKSTVVLWDDEADVVEAVEPSQEQDDWQVEAKGDDVPVMADFSATDISEPSDQAEPESHDHSQSHESAEDQQWQNEEDAAEHLGASDTDHHAPEAASDAVSAGPEKSDDEGSEDSPSLSDVGRESRSRLETTIAELEAAITGQSEEWEPDGSEATPVMDWASTVAEPAFLSSRYLSKSETIEDAEEVVEKDAPYVLNVAPAADQQAEPPKERESAPNSAGDLADDLGGSPTAALDGELDETLTAYLEEEEILDEETLRNLVVEIVRQELQGALGERITRNVRKLVRREIHRVLSSQEFD